MTPRSALIVVVMASMLTLSLSAPSSESAILSDHRENAVVHEENRKTRECVCKSSGCKEPSARPTPSRYGRQPTEEAQWCHVESRCKDEIKKKYSGGYYSEEPCKPITARGPSKAPNPGGIVPGKKIATGRTYTSSHDPNNWMTGGIVDPTWDATHPVTTVSDEPTSNKQVEPDRFPFQEHKDNSCSGYLMLVEKVKDGDANFTPNTDNSADVADKAKEACMEECGKHFNCLSFEFMTEPDKGHTCHLSTYCYGTNLSGMDLCTGSGATCSTFTKVFLKGFEHP